MTTTATRIATGPNLIAAGLALLVLTGFWPLAPGLTGMACVALGATIATIARYEHHPALAPIVGLHLATYLALYALFVGARLTDTAAVMPAGWKSVDLMASGLMIVLAVRRALLAAQVGQPR